jgi:RNase P/RNase MRP subunit POP5
MDRVGQTPCEVRTLRTSGTIKTLKEKYRDRIGDPGIRE